MEEAKKPSAALWKKILFYAVFGISLTTFIVSGIFILRYVVESNRQESNYNDLAQILESLRATAPTAATKPTVPSAPTDAPTVPTETQPPTILPEYQPFYDMNNDMVGWITVPDTKINYPVMQTPNNPNYYLKRTFDHEHSDWGAIYVREVCDVNKPSDNLTLYGHHMKDGSMFSGLDKFKRQSFWETHRTFTFDTLYEHHTYEIICCFKTTGNLSDGFPYHRFVDAKDEAEFDAFVETIKSMAFYETGVTAEYGDKLICLSTCEYTQANGRFVVVAKRIT